MNIDTCIAFTSYIKLPQMLIKIIHIAFINPQFTSKGSLIDPWRAFGCGKSAACKSILFMLEANIKTTLIVMAFCV
jgi:hypothetical protein